jgi:hypothetical protein
LSANDLGTLVTVSLRDVWPHEAHNFTPWLLDNADKLGQVLGMDIELSRAEHPVGGFSLDLIGQDTTTGDRLIIENQLEQSDHSHLGQLITYASGTDAVNIIWLAASFRSEHRASIDWLNARTDEKTRFFAVEISAVQIDQSRKAPLLKLVAQPNDWNKTVKAATSSLMTERGNLYFEFWTQYLARVNNEYPSWTSSNKAPAANWINLKSGAANVGLGVNFSLKGLRSEIYFGDANAEVNARRFEFLRSQKERFEQDFGSQLSWEPLEDRIACRIAFYGSGSIEDRDQWESYIDWFIDSQSELRKALAPHVERLKSFSPGNRSDGF